MAFALQRHVNIRSLWERQLANRMLDANFPKRYSAQVNVIRWRLNSFRNQGGQTWIAARQPVELAGVEQNDHSPSNACRISCGKGALKSCGTANSPFARPIGLGSFRGVGCSPEAARPGPRMVRRPFPFSGSLAGSRGTILP